jgi:flagellar protein FlaI
MAKKEERGYISTILAEIPPEGKVETAPAPAEEEIKPVLWEAPEVPSGAKVLDRYGECEILSVEGEVLPLYRLKLPQLSDSEKKLLKIVKERAAEEVKVDPSTVKDPSALRQLFLKETIRIGAEEAKKLHVPSSRVKVISELAVRDMLGYGPLDPLLADDKLEDILVIGTGKPVYVYHRKYGMCCTNVVFEDEESIRYLIEKMARVVGRRIDQQVPLLDARLPDGSRVNATLPPVSLDGPTISIRKFRSDPLTVVDLLNYGTLNLEVASFLWAVTDGFGVKPANILISGGTGSGKTTTLNTLSSFVPERERIISIEDTAELQLFHKHWVRLECVHPHTFFIDGSGVLRRVGESFEEEAKRHTGRTILSGPNLYLEYPNPLSSVLATKVPELETFPDTLELLGRTHIPEYWVVIRTADGSRLRVTPNSPLLVLSGGKKVELPARKVKVGDYLPILASVDLPGEEVSIDPKKFAHWRVHRSQASPVLKKMVKEARRLGYTNAKLAREMGISEKALENYLYKKIQNHVPLHLLLRLSEILGRELPSFTRWVGNRGKQVIHLPAKLDEHLAYLIGVISGDGSLEKYRVKIYPGTKLETLKTSKKVFGVAAKLRIRQRVRKKREICYVLDSVLIAEFVHKFFEIPIGKKARALKVPEVIQRAKENVVVAYLAGLVDSDGCVDYRNGRIFLTTTSRELATGVRYLLCRLGVFSKVWERRGGYKPTQTYQISVSGEDAKKLAEKLRPYVCKRNRTRLNYLLKSSRQFKPRAVGGREGDIVWCRVTQVRKEWNYQALHSYNIAPSSTHYYPAGEMGFVATNPNTRPPNIEGRGEITMDDLVKNALRMRPDRLIVGEVRGPEALTMFTAMNTGHEGCMGTLHANSAAETITRLTEPPMSVPPIMIPALDIIIMQQRILHKQKGTVRRITEVAEVTGLEGGRPQLSRIYVWDAKKDDLLPTNVPSRTLRTISEFSGMTLGELQQEMKRRQKVLAWLVKKGIRDLKRVSEVIQRYYLEPEKVLKEVA